MFDLFNRDYIGLQTVGIDNPAAGANLYWESPEYTRILVHSITFQLVSDANAANRRVCIQASHGSVAFSQAPAPGHQVASETIYYRFCPCILGIDESADLSYMWAPISEHLFLDPHHSLQTAVINIQATDQISDIYLRYYQRMPR